MVRLRSSRDVRAISIRGLIRVSWCHLNNEQPDRSLRARGVVEKRTSLELGGSLEHHQSGLGLARDRPMCRDRDSAEDSISAPMIQKYGHLTVK